MACANVYTLPYSHLCFFSFSCFQHIRTDNTLIVLPSLKKIQMIDEAFVMKLISRTGYLVHCCYRWIEYPRQEIEREFRSSRILLVLMANDVLSTSVRFGKSITDLF